MKESGEVRPIVKGLSHARGPHTLPATAQKHPRRPQLLHRSAHLLPPSPRRTDRTAALQLKTYSVDNATVAAAAGLRRDIVGSSVLRARTAAAENKQNLISAHCY